MDESEFDAAWSEIEGLVPDVALDPAKVGEVVVVAGAVHPLRDRILERVGAGERPSIRLMKPDHEALERGEGEPIMVQVYLAGSAEAEFISIVTTSILSFAADPERPADEQPHAVEFEYTPDIFDLGDGKVIDQGKLPPLLEVMMAGSTNAERIAEVRLRHPGINFLPLENGMLEVSLDDDGEKVVIGSFDPEILQP
jgi:hypothetical protein